MKLFLNNGDMIIIVTDLVKSDNRGGDGNGTIFLLLYLIDDDAVLPHCVYDEGFWIRAPGDVRRMVKIDVHP